MSTLLSLAAGMAAAVFVWWSTMRLFVRRAAERLRADPARVAQLEYELGIMEPYERQLYESGARSAALRYAPPTYRPGEKAVRHRGGVQSPAALATTIKELWTTERLLGGSYVVHEDDRGIWHEYSDGRRVFVQSTDYQ